MDSYGYEPEVTLQYPSARVAGLRSQASPGLPSTVCVPEPISVLIVEDNPGDADLTLECLGGLPGHDFKVTVCESLGAALAHLGAAPADVVLLDLNLPDSQGVETLRRLRGAAGDAAVVVLTGVLDDELRHVLLGEGAQDVIEKGVWAGPRVLPHATVHALERHRALRQALLSATQPLYAVLAAAPDALIVTDPGALVRYANPAALSLFGCTRAEFLGAAAGFPVGGVRRAQFEIRRDLQVIHAEARLRPVSTG